MSWDKIHRALTAGAAVIAATAMLAGLPVGAMADEPTRGTTQAQSSSEAAAKSDTSSTSVGTQADDASQNQNKQTHAVDAAGTAEKSAASDSDAAGVSKDSAATSTSTAAGSDDSDKTAGNPSDADTQKDETASVTIDTRFIGPHGPSWKYDNVEPGKLLKDYDYDHRPSPADPQCPTVNDHDYIASTDYQLIDVLLTMNPAQEESNAACESKYKAQIDAAWKTNGSSYLLGKSVYSPFIIYGWKISTTDKNGVTTTSYLKDANDDQRASQQMLGSWRIPAGTTTVTPILKLRANFIGDHAPVIKNYPDYTTGYPQHTTADFPFTVTDNGNTGTAVIEVQNLPTWTGRPASVKAEHGPYRPGYDFAGWKMDKDPVAANNTTNNPDHPAGSLVKAGDKITITYKATDPSKTPVFRSVWTPATYNLCFDLSEKGDQKEASCTSSALPKMTRQTIATGKHGETVDRAFFKVPGYPSDAPKADLFDHWEVESPTQWQHLWTTPLGTKTDFAPGDSLWMGGYITNNDVTNATPSLIYDAMRTVVLKPVFRTPDPTVLPDTPIPWTPLTPSKPATTPSVTPTTPTTPATKPAAITPNPAVKANPAAGAKKAALPDTGSTAVPAALAALTLLLAGAGLALARTRRNAAHRIHRIR